MAMFAAVNEMQCLANSFIRAAYHSTASTPYSAAFTKFICMALAESISTITLLNDALTISTQAGMTRVELDDITYIEVQNHQLTYHTAEGTYAQYGTMATLEAQLSQKGFARCNSCYLVNLQHVREIQGYTLILTDGAELKISQPRKKAFIALAAAYFAGRQKE